jgi:isocitrate dehydrogenase kinase/phosphatase
MEPTSAAKFIQQHYKQFYATFNELTTQAKHRFLLRQWVSQREAMRSRILLHNSAIERISKELSARTRPTGNNLAWWKETANTFDKATGHNAIARSFFDSVGRTYFKGDLAFTLFSAHQKSNAIPLPLKQYQFDVAADFLKAGLKDIGFDISDFQKKADRVEAKLKSVAPQPLRIFMYPHLFYRNKHAYWIGYLETNDHKMPLCFAFRNSHLQVELNALLTTEEEIKNVFAFSRSYFLVETQYPDALVEFLLMLMPSKPRDQLFINLGYQQYGKELVVHQLQQHLQHNRTQFLVAPGIPGMVMMVFTLPNYDLVFKLIRDNFRPPKFISHEEVIEKYRFISLHDRVGRLADAQHFEYLGLPIAYFRKDLLDILLRECSQSTAIRNGIVCFQNIYTERKMTPLNVYLQPERAAEENNRAVIDFGNAIYEMAMSNIFPGDLLIKNFGVTAEGRVVFYDYDEIVPLVTCQFKDMPTARSDEEEMSAEPWYAIQENDIFPQELVKFLLPEGEWRNLFAQHHAQLYTAAFWNKMKKIHERGELIDIQPYIDNL